MKISIIISDNLYGRLVSDGCRVQGSLGLVNPTEGNFKEHRKSRGRKGDKFIKLPYDKANMVKDHVWLTLLINHAEREPILQDCNVEKTYKMRDVINEKENSPHSTHTQACPYVVPKRCKLIKFLNIVLKFIHVLWRCFVWKWTSQLFNQYWLLP